MIPFVNLRRQILQLKPALDAALADIIDTQSFIKGAVLKKFEREWLEALGASHGVGCANGTAALSLALEALGIGKGDEVITSAHTFFATAEAILHVGAHPVFADIEMGSYTLDPAAIAAAIGPKTRAILPVHIYGSPCAMDEIMALADKHHLAVIEDAAQAHLACHRGRMAGTIGDAAGFSFYPGKNLGAFGDAGFIVARDPAVASRLAKLVDHGRESKYVHDVVGYNQRLDTLQAAVLSVKLPHLAGWTENRRARAAQYDRKLRPHGFKTIEPIAGAEPVYHLYTVEVSNREETIGALKEAGIETGVHFPVPLHLQPALAFLGAKPGALPNTESIASRTLSLPICGALTEEEAERVGDAFLTVARP